MADNVTINGIIFATDEVPPGSNIHDQRIKIDVGTDGVSTPAESDTVLKAMPVTPRYKRVLIAATGLATGISTTKYTEKDAVGPTLSFTNAARASGGTGVVRAVTVADSDRQRPGLDLMLFSATVSATDNAIFAPTFANLGICVGVIRLPDGGGWRDVSTVSAVSYVVPDGGLPYICNATTLFGVLVARSLPVPTFTGTSSLSLTATLDLD